MAEQILIEFIGDATKLEPTITLLQKLGQLSEADVESFKKMNAEGAKSFDAMNKGATTLVPNLKKAEEGVSTLADAVETGLHDGLADAFVSAGASVEDFGKKGKKSLEDISKSFTDLEKKSIASTYKKTVEDISKSLGMTEAKAKEFVQQMSKTGQLKINGQITQDLKLLQQAIIESGGDFEEFIKHIEKLTPAAEGADNATKSFKTRLRELKEELSSLEDQGKENTAEFEALAIEAAKLEDQIGDTAARVRAMASDTFKFDAAIGAVSGVAAAFSVAQGTEALFGKESEAIQKTLLKVNAAMAILTGLQQIQTLIKKESVVVIATERIQRLAGVAATNLETAAQSKNIVIKAAATVTMKALNAVMAANPVFLLIGAFAALGAALAFFSGKSDDAKRQTDLLNIGLEREKQIVSDLANQNNFRTQLVLLNAQRSGASSIQLAEIQKQSYIKDAKDYADAARRKQETAERFFHIHVATIKSAQQAQDEIALIDANLAQLGSNATENAKQKAETLKNILKGMVEDFNNAEKATQQATIINDQNILAQMQKNIKSAQAFAEARVFLAKAGSKAELEAQIGAINARVAAEKKLNHDLSDGERIKLEAEASRQILEIKNKELILALENSKALTEAQLANAKEGSIQELELRKKVAAQQADIDANAFGLSGEKINAIRQKGKQEQLDFDRQIAQKRIEIDLNGIRARLASVKEGSADELKLRLDEAKKEFDFNLQAKGLTDDKRLLLEEEYLKKVRELHKNFDSQIFQNAFATALSQTNASLADLQRANVSENNAQLIDLKKKAIDEQEMLDSLNAVNTIKNEQLLQAKLLEIKKNAEAAKAAVDEQAKTFTINSSLELANARLENEKKQQELISAGASGSIGSRIEARNKIKQIAKEQVDNELSALNDLHAQGLINEEDYQKQLLAIKGKYLDLDLQQQQEKEQLKQQIIGAGFSALQQMADAFFESSNANRQADLDNESKKIDSQRQKELDNKNLTEQQKADLDAKFDQRQKILKRKAAEADKRAKIEQAEINGLITISKTFAEYGFTPAGAIAAAAALIETGIIIAKIQNTKIPEFKTGTKRAPKGYAWVGEEGPELVELSGGEKIWTYNQSKKVAAAWENGVAATPDEIISGNIASPVDPDMISNTYVNAGGEMFIDYDQLGKSVAKHMPAPVQNNIAIDKNGLSHFIVEEGNKTQIKNQRYKID